MLKYKAKFKSFYSSNPVLIQRGIQAVTGLVTSATVICCLSVHEQGWYYTLGSLAALYALFDFGLSVVIIQITSHIFTRAHWGHYGSVGGSSSGEFYKLVKHSVHIYLILGLVYSILIGSFGLFFFSNRDGVDAALNGTNWLFPWLILVIFSALNLLTTPYMAFVEGSGNVKEISSLRIVQNLLGSLFLWVALYLELDLWAISMMPVLSFLIALNWLVITKRDLLKVPFQRIERDFHWWSEVWPLQWRVGLSWISGYLMIQIYTPILFHFNGPKVAGQMGLSLTLINMVGLLAQSWIARRVPAMGKAVARKDWNAFDRCFKRDFFISVGMFFIVGLLILLLIFLLGHFTSYGERFLSVLPFGILLIVGFINHIIGALTTHLRSYKREPLVFIAMFSTIISMLFALYVASESSVLGVIVVILLVQISFSLPITFFYWLKFNRKWRAEL